MTVVNVTNAVLKGSMRGPTGTATLDGTTFTGTVTYDVGSTEPPIEPPTEITAPIIDWLRPASNLTDDALRTMNGGTASYNDPVVFGRSGYGGATVTAHWNGSQGTATTDSDGNWNYALPVLENAAYSMAATVTSGGKTSAATTFTFTVAHSGSTVPPTNTYGKIENFTATNGGYFKVDGFTASGNTCNKPHCLVKIDDYTLRFEVQQGDVWAASGGSYQDSGCNRSEVAFQDHLMDEGAPIGWEGTVTVLPGPVSTGSWFSLIQCHASTNVAPTYCPFGIGIERNTDKLQVTLQEPNQTHNNYVYTSPSAIVRGQPMRLKATVKMARNGYVGVWWDDKQVVNFNGPVYATNSTYYWKYGAYRGTAPEVVKVDFKNVHIITG